MQPRLLASSADLAGVRREHLAGDGAERERPGVARARLRGPERAALRPWPWLRRARAAMRLLRLLALAALAPQPEVAGGAETVGNSSVGKVGGGLTSAPQVALAFLARSKSTSGSSLAAEAVRSASAGMDPSPCLQKEVPSAEEAS